ncbi:Zn-dependent exopeptidase [Rhizopus microsporus var. microsporus]|nr:Zn-dependent exopeptidase [Rhizopus microsporus var. microsporus]
MLNLPSPKRLRSYLKTYTSEPHVAGTLSDKRQAEWTRQKFNEFGIPDSKIVTYYPLLNYPVSRRLEIVSGPEELRYVAKLKEDRIEEDPSSENPDIVPLFHGYSKNGTARGPVVYANYGRLEDFQFLVDQGVQVNGSIALVRYGPTVRGLKIKAAEKYGCVGVLIFSDPMDDGPIGKENEGAPAESYPNGPWRAPSSAQRGSVSYIALGIGDPLTPGYAATENATRIPMEESPMLPKIPSLPLSWEDALPLLKATEGHGVFGEFDWVGGLEGVQYYSGPSEGIVEMENIVKYNVTPIWNVIGRIEGSVEPHRSVIIGNHRDAWVYGAVDPSSGSAALLEVARVLGQMLQTGWRPRRTIILASWDAEEYGLIGSTEWVEENVEWLKEEAAAYINCDSAVAGPFFTPGATPSLNKLLYEVTSLIPDPRTGKSVYDAWLERSKATNGPVEKPTVGVLGSGSDFTAFLDHVGIPSIDMSFDGNYGVYHSVYDSFHYMEKFGDPTFEYHAAMTKIFGLLALRLADDLVLPMHPIDYSTELQSYVHKLHAYTAPHTFPTLKKSVHTLLKTAAAFETSMAQLNEKLKKFNQDDDKKLAAKWSKRVEKMNQRLVQFERSFIDADGIAGREWFKHVVYAPGLWTGYSGQVFPAISEAFDDKNMSLARRAESKAAKCVQKAQEALL